MPTEELSLLALIKDAMPMMGVVIGASIPLIKDWLSGRRAEKLERIKLHDSERISAYKKAYQFSSLLRMSLEDKTQAKDLAFLNTCSGELYSLLENLPYYSPKVRNSLIELENVLESIMKNIMNVASNSKLVVEKVSQISSTLKQDLLEDFKMWE